MAPAGDFTYSPLRIREIRIITLLPGAEDDKICCTLQHASLDDHPTFEALSYVWGPEELYASILIDGKSFYVLRNLWFALYHLRGTKTTIGRVRRADEFPKGTSKHASQSLQSITSDGPLGRPLRSNKLSEESSSSASPSTNGGSTPLKLWIDALCINQSDTSERNSQVQQMGSIYSKAAGLHIWLGESYDASDNAMGDFARAESDNGMDDLTIDGTQQPLVQPMKTMHTNPDPCQWSKSKSRICHRPYWRRLWVIQEVVLAQNRTLRCGSRSIDWEKFVAGFQLKKSHPVPWSWNTGAFRNSREAEFGASPAGEFVEAVQYTRALGIGNSPLRSLIRIFAKSQTQDPRDMVYGLLALAAPTGGVAADYSKTEAEIYVDVITASIWNSTEGWDGWDEYLVAFSQLLQRVLGSPYWDEEVGSFVALKTGGLNGEQKVCVGGILGKSIEWGESTVFTPPASEPQLPQGSISSCKTVAYQLVKAFDPSQSGAPVLHNFTVSPYACYWPKTREGTALLARPCREGEYLCFFEDCDVVAVVRLKDGSLSTYVVVDCAVIVPAKLDIDSESAIHGAEAKAVKASHSKFKVHDWTVKCHVEMSLDTLRKLTM